MVKNYFHRDVERLNKYMTANSLPRSDVPLCAWMQNDVSKNPFYKTIASILQHLFRPYYHSFCTKITLSG